MSDPLREAGLANLQADLFERGWSYSDLARACGLTPNAISHLMTGYRYGAPETQAKIAEAMNTDPGLYFPRTQLELERALCCEGVAS